MTPRFTGPLPKLAAIIAATLTLAVSACRDFTGVPASLPVISDSGAIFALNGAPPGAPNAVYFFAGTMIAADASFLFDVAFDIDSAGNVVYLPEPAVASGLVSSHTVSLAQVSDNYDSLSSAPRVTYRADTALVVKPGVTVVAQSSDPNACSVSLTGTTLYAKMVVDSIDRVNKRLFLRYTSDPNCGFRSFAPGIPKD